MNRLAFALPLVIASCSIDRTEVDPAEVPTQSTLSCAAGDLVSWNGAGWDCIAPAGATEYSAGDGLILEGSEFSLAGAGSGWPAGQKMTGLDEGGLPTCADDVDTDTDTTYSAGAGLTLAGTSFAISFAATSCPPGQKVLLRLTPDILIDRYGDVIRALQR